MKVVIIGGVAGGATAAARLRRLDEQAEIVVFERSGYVSYANCGLPYYIGGVIEDPEALTLQTPESFFSRFRVTMKVRHEVTALHPERKTVSVKNLETGEEFEEPYDKLLLSPGAKPTQPRLPGVGLEKLFTLRTVEDTFRIKDYIRQNHPKSAVLAGGGFIGLELAENLRELGMEVTIVQRPKQLMNPFDPDMAAFIHSEVRANGVKLALGYTVEGFQERDGGVDVLLKDNAPLHADMVVLAIGVTPDTALAKEAGLELGLKGSIVVNSRMETSLPDIYAVGDAVQVRHSVTGQDVLLSLAGPANKQGRIAADNICGGDSRYLGSQGSSVLKVFGMTAAVTGVSETNAKKAGLDADAVVLSPMSHAGYYPGGKLMTMKVIFEKETFRLLGAQIVGYEGVDKRIDVLAAAIHAGLTAIRLKDLDLAYAPPYSSAKDPVNMAGFLIENLAKGVVKQFRIEDVGGLPRDGSVTLLDARTPQEYAAGHIEGFRNIPVDELRQRLGEIAPGKPVYVICQSGLRSYIACRILAGHGYEAHNFSGGFRFYDAVANDRRLIESATACGMDQ
ncbi:FAD-dependent oxidoreductase [uncultured Oscillibacter sp.]|uniref:FAD-dependent oxidoreductase n=1 Tax=uncultured Oscillibacter sp. TaxID=876091 RepID=UPI00216F4C34|nr:FAD-dependent oxidoreductase [uncultured Oscillibacter sp.]MCI9012192.1 FAD-dependent oxidoreductase [Oscillibacter sp.]